MASRLANLQLIQGVSQQAQQFAQMMQQQQRQKDLLELQKKELEARLKAQDIATQDLQEGRAFLQDARSGTQIEGPPEMTDAGLSFPRAEVTPESQQENLLRAGSSFLGAQSPSVQALGTNILSGLLRPQIDPMGAQRAQLELLKNAADLRKSEVQTLKEGFLAQKAQREVGAFDTLDNVKQQSLSTIDAQIQGAPNKAVKDRLNLFKQRISAASDSSELSATLKDLGTVPDSYYQAQVQAGVAPQVAYQNYLRLQADSQIRVQKQTHIPNRDEQLATAMGLDIRNLTPEQADALGQKRAEIDKEVLAFTEKAKLIYKGLDGTQQTAFADISNLLLNTEEAMFLLSNDLTGLWQTPKEQLKMLWGKGDPRFVRFQSLIKSIGTAVTQEITGAHFSAKEKADINAMTGRIEDNPATLFTILPELSRQLKQKLDSIAIGATTPAGELLEKTEGRLQGIRKSKSMKEQALRYFQPDVGVVKPIEPVKPEEPGAPAPGYIDSLKQRVFGR